jgi:hypothetical protein
MATSRGDWLVPFTGRNASGVYNQNFLWRDDSLYVMDNHRAAMWCWLQHVDPNQPHSLFHMDRHYDCLDSRMTEWLENCPDDLRRLSVAEYLNYDYAFTDFGSSDRVQLFSWDNYLSIYLARYGNSLNQLRMCTHEDGNEPQQHFIRGVAQFGTGVMILEPSFSRRERSVAQVRRGAVTAPFRCMPNRPPQAKAPGCPRSCRGRDPPRGASRGTMFVGAA